MVGHRGECGECQGSGGFPGQPCREGHGVVAGRAIVIAWSILQETY
jgi:hypothetical protein